MDMESSNLQKEGEKKPRNRRNGYNISIFMVSDKQWRLTEKNQCRSQTIKPQRLHKKILGVLSQTYVITCSQINYSRYCNTVSQLSITRRKKINIKQTGSHSHYYYMLSKVYWKRQQQVNIYFLISGIKTLRTTCPPCMHTRFNFGLPDIYL